MARRQKTVYDYLALFTLPGVRNVDWQQYDIRLRKVEPGSYLVFFEGDEVGRVENRRFFPEGYVWHKQSPEDLWCFYSAIDDSNDCGYGNRKQAAAKLIATLTFKGVLNTDKNARRIASSPILFGKVGDWEEVFPMHSYQTQYDAYFYFVDYRDRKSRWEVALLLNQEYTLLNYFDDIARYASEEVEDIVADWVTLGEIALDRQVLDLVESGFLSSTHSNYSLGVIRFVEGGVLDPESPDFDEEELVEKADDVAYKKGEPVLDQVFDYVAQQLENAFDEGVLL